VSEPTTMRKDPRSERPSGFSLLEMMISMVILLGVTGIVMSGLLQTTQTEGTVQNRTEMHAAVRSATELMQQEIGQAGRVALPPIANIQLTTAVSAGQNQQGTLTNGATAGVFVNEYLIVDAGSNQETVQVLSVSGNNFNANFRLAHLANVPVSAQGGFGTGVVPQVSAGMANGSDDTHLKLYGDINGDGNMVYVEYICDWAGSGNLYRSESAFNAATIVAKQVLLPNLYNQGNPNGTPCFVYQEEPVGCNSTAANPCFVTDVAVTLTVQTSQPDPYTGLYQRETKALLNVSPRNVFDAYQLSTLSNNRVEPMPSTVRTLLSQTP
jgi:prepilin-type N-terminal cleavage/methylation domain-containing protein